MGAYAMGAPWLRFGFDCGERTDRAQEWGELERRLRDGWAEMTGKTQTDPAGRALRGQASVPVSAVRASEAPVTAGRRGHAGMRGPKARRGDVRAAILSVLSDAPRNGYQVIQEIAERTGGAWKPSPGSIYPTLQQLEDEGLVVQTEDGGRKAYALTDEGRGYVDEPSRRDGRTVGGDGRDRRPTATSDRCSVRSPRRCGR